MNLYSLSFLIRIAILLSAALLEPMVMYAGRKACGFFRAFRAGWMSAARDAR